MNHVIHRFSLQFPKRSTDRHREHPVRQELNRQFLAPSAEEADFVVLEHCVTYAYHVLRGKPRDGMGICHDFDRSISYIIYNISCTYYIYI